MTSLAQMEDNLPRFLYQARALIKALSAPDDITKEISTEELADGLWLLSDRLDEACETYEAIMKAHYKQSHSTAIESADKGCPETAPVEG